MKTWMGSLMCKTLGRSNILLHSREKPGELALKMNENALRSLVLPPLVIAVTGSCGKTSVVNMLTAALQKDGKRVLYSQEGGHSLPGIATTLLAACDRRGVLPYDAFIMEVEPRECAEIFSHIAPTHCVVTNLLRDRPAQNGHIERLYHDLKENIPQDAVLVLNADDPLAASLGCGRENAVYFGVQRLRQSTDCCTALYRDTLSCPACGGTLHYSYYHYHHLGDYHCENCGFARPAPRYAVTEVKPGGVEFDGRWTVSGHLQCIYPAYNLVAAYAAALEAGAAENNAVKGISSCREKEGRELTFSIGDTSGRLILAKHGCPASYEQAIQRVVPASAKGGTVAILIDQMSRRSFTADMSWLWETDFSLLSHPNIRRIVLGGRYCHDLATRLQYSVDLGPLRERLFTVPQVDELVQSLGGNQDDALFLITSYADRNRFLKDVKMSEEPFKTETIVG